MVGEPDALERDIDDIAMKELDDLIEEVMLDACFETHRAAKQGYLFIDGDGEDDRTYAIVCQSGMDVFGEPISNGQAKKTVECQCPSCSRGLAAQRFAPHLEKCMGMGRNSSRIASKRIASATGKANGDSDDVDDYDNSADGDWNYNHDSKKTKKKHKANGVVKKSKTNVKSSLAKTQQQHS